MSDFSSVLFFLILRVLRFCLKVNKKKNPQHEFISQSFLFNNTFKRYILTQRCHAWFPTAGITTLQTRWTLVISFTVQATAHYKWYSVGRRTMSNGTSTCVITSPLSGATRCIICHHKDQYQCKHRSLHLWPFHLKRFCFQYKQFYDHRQLQHTSIPSQSTTWALWSYGFGNEILYWCHARSS